jgi:glutathione S-transferase
MARPTLYGMSGSRALRSVWAMEEIGIDYEHVPTHFVEESKAADYMSLNPNGRIPTLVDGDLTLFESMAINLYAAKKYGGALYPANAADEARAIQWSVWVMTEIEPLQMQIVVQKIFTPEEKRDASVIERATKGLERPLKVLDAHLADRTYLFGDEFSIADLNVSGVMVILNMIEFDLSAHGNITRWMGACHERPSFAQAQSKDERTLR